jgi:hypothetical protein
LFTAGLRRDLDAVVVGPTLDYNHAGTPPVQNRAIRPRRVLACNSLLRRARPRTLGH